MVKHIFNNKKKKEEKSICDIKVLVHNFLLFFFKKRCITVFKERSIPCVQCQKLLFAKTSYRYTYTYTYLCIKDYRKFLIFFFVNCRFCVSFFFAIAHSTLVFVPFDYSCVYVYVYVCICLSSFEFHNRR